jgi:hypothetical protein
MTAYLDFSKNQARIGGAGIAVRASAARCKDQPGSSPGHFVRKCFSLRRHEGQKKSRQFPAGIFLRETGDYQLR